jgi:cap-associated protein CAF20
MVKSYTETELIELNETAVVPSRFDFVEFSKSIEEQRELQQKLEEEGAANSARRGSTHGAKPKFTFQKKPRVKTEAPQPDADGWVTLNKRKNSVSGEGAKETVRDTIRDQQVNKIRTNSKKMAAASSSDSRDIIAESAKSKFNAFAALNSDSEEESEEESEDDEE